MPKKYSETICIKIQLQHWGGECQLSKVGVVLDYFKTKNIFGEVNLSIIHTIVNKTNMMNLPHMGT